MPIYLYIMATIDNPHYNPYPEPPPAYTMGFQKAPTAASDPVAASAGLNSAIHLNGRHPVAVVCPSCRNPVVTQTTQIVSPVLAGTRRSVWYTFAGMILIILCFFTAVRLFSGSSIPLFIMPVFILFILVGFGGVTYHRRRAAVIYSDVHHSCPVCKANLGVSNGLQLYQMHRTGNHINAHLQPPQRY